MKKLMQLFLSNFMISLCTFGGGYVIAGFMKEKFVDQLHWISETEMLDMIALAQAAPGAVAVNTSIMVGWKIAGFWGMVVSTLGTVLPPMLILILISAFYEAFMANPYIAVFMRGMQAGVCAIILNTVVSMLEPERGNSLALLLTALTFVLAYVFHINVMFIVLGGIGLGLLFAWRKVHASGTVS